MNEFQQNIIKKIKTGEIDMKPKWYFVWRSTLLVFGVVVVALLGIYLLSFVLFALRQSGVGFVPLYGFKGISQFVVSSPWLLIAAAGGFIILLQVLVSRYSFSYQRPLVYSMVSIICLVLLASFAIEQSIMHDRIQRFSEGRDVPVLAALYRGVTDQRPDTIFVGRVVELTDQGLVLMTQEGDRLTVIIDTHTRQKQGVVYEVDDTVAVFGDKEGSVVSALGVRIVPEGRQGQMNVDSEEMHNERSFTDKPIIQRIHQRAE